MTTTFTKWLGGELLAAGHYQTLILQAYQRADLANRSKLEAIHPEWFTELS